MPGGSPSHLLIMMLGFAINAAPVYAQSLSEIRESLKKSEISEKPSAFEFSLQLENRQYFRSTEPYFRDDAAGQANSFELGIRGQAERRGFIGGVNVKDTYEVNENFHYIKPKELYAGFSKGAFQFAVGRKLNVWSQADEHWRMGTWQPRFTDDKLERETAGLTGAFAQISNDRHKIVLFGSGLHVPDMGANFELEGNGFVSNNPWFRPPASLVMINDKPTDVRYQFKRPSAEDVALHGSVAAQYEFQSPTGNFVRASYAHKPLNQILIGAPIELLLLDPPNALVEVNARVLYHDLYTLELGRIEKGGIHAWASISRDNPIRDQTPADWTTQEAIPANIFSSYLGFDFGGFTDSSSHVFLSYLRVDGGDGRARGKVETNESLFERRYYYQDAVQAGIRHRFPSFKRMAEVMSTVLYELGQHGTVISTELTQSIDTQWSAQVRVDFIGLADTQGTVQDGFTSLYRANDRVQMGVRYVF